MLNSFPIFEKYTSRGDRQFLGFCGLDLIGGGGLFHLVRKELLVFVILGELGEEPGQHSAIAALLNKGCLLLLIEFFDKGRAVRLHLQEAFNVIIGQVLVGALASVSLDGLSNHLRAGEVLAIGAPLFVFGSAKDTGLFLESLGDLGVGSVDGDNGISFHVNTLLFINYFTDLRGAAVLCPSLCFEYSMRKRKSCALTRTCVIINIEK